MINQNFDILAALLTIIGSLIYAADSLKNKAKPNRVSWLLWTLTPLITFLAELAQHVRLEVTLLTLAETVGSFLVLLISFINPHAYWQLSRPDLACGFVAALALVLWLVTGKGDLAIICSLLAALFSSVPTITKSYQFPGTESAIAYLASTAAGIITLLTVQHWTIGNYGFPLYLASISALISFLILTPDRTKSQPQTTNPGISSEPGIPPLIPQTSIATTPLVGAPNLPSAAPSALVAPSPAQLATLFWNPVPGASSYNIYREGALAGSARQPSFTDVKAFAGSYQYYVTAVTISGQSSPSNTITVLVDREPPRITYKQDPAPNANGWNNTPVTIRFTGEDTKVGIASVSPPVTLDKDGAHQPVTGSVMNFAGESASVTANINLDQTPPDLGDPTWTNNPATPGVQATVTIPVIDHLSGVAGGEYSFSPDARPGEGKPLYLRDGHLHVTFKTNLPPGSYPIYLRAQDIAGNWSELDSTTLEVTASQTPVEESSSNLQTSH